MLALSEEIYAQVVQILLDAGVEVKVQGGKHVNALQAASYYKDEELVQMLIDAGAEMND